MPVPSQLPIPEEVLRIVQALEGAGYETWCVGGAVRDNLIGYENHDFDLATAAPPGVVQQLFRRTVPVGIEHGTVAVLDRRNRPHEVTTFRRDVKTDGRHAVVEFGADLNEDLARRDFTINAIAYHALRHEWRDPFGGQADIGRRLIRAVGDPRQRFREDYLRILRALRFAARFGFEIDRATWDAAVELADGLAFLSAERVRDEWFKGLASARDQAAFVDLWARSGALGRWMPEVRGEPWAGGTVAEGALIGSSDGKRLTAYVRDDSVADSVLVTSALSSDPVATLTRLRCSRAEIARGERIARMRDRYPDPADPVAVRRWMAEAGEGVDDLITLRREYGPVVQQVREAGAPLAIRDLAIGGNDLVELGVPPGPVHGRVLRALLDHVLEQPEHNTREFLIERARTLVTDREPR